MAAPRVAVVILNWRRPQDTLGCLRSLAASDYPTWEAIVVDNASGDESVPCIRAAFPQVQVLVTERNLGFAGGCNVGLRHALAAGFPYILLLNNDVEVEPTALGTLVAAAEAHPRAGILSPLILYADGGRVWFAGAYRRRFLPGISMPAYRRRRPIPPHPRPTDYATGCAVLLRREMLQEIGLLDESYFMYWEDWDLSERARRSGWQVLLIPTAVVRHHVSASTGEDAPAKWYYLGRYLPTFYRRYYRRPRFSILTYAAWVVGRELLRGNGRAVKPFWQGLREGWRSEISGR
ncbi:MAG: glycosyltransferase family 2 protein [Chloroflexia bacterium]